MMKWLILAVVVVAVLWWLGRGRRGPREADAHAPRPGAAAPRGPSRPTQAPQSMVACAHCGVWLPQSDATAESVAGPYFCSESHRRAGPNQG